MGADARLKASHSSKICEILRFLSFEGTITFLQNEQNADFLWYMAGFRGSIMAGHLAGDKVLRVLGVLGAGFCLRFFRLFGRFGVAFSGSGLVGFWGVSGFRSRAGVLKLASLSNASRQSNS